MIITDILRKNSTLYPEKTALIERIPATGERTQISWADFYGQSIQTANALQAKGIKKGDKVVQLMTNSLEWLPIYFGVLYTGAWIVPLNFRFESDKIRLCTVTAEARVFIFGPEFVARLEEIRLELSRFVTLWIFTGPEKDCPDWACTFSQFICDADHRTPPDVPLTPEDDAALYFTSGTTGTPKAVLHTHKALFHACEVENNHHGQTHDDVFLCIPPLYHTGAKMHWMGSFLVGGKCVLLNGVKPEWIIEAVSGEKCTIVWLLVPWAHDILIAVENGTIRLADHTLGQWRLMHIGAQPVPPSLIRNWRKHFPDQDYDTNYGLTESSGPGCIHLGVENAKNENRIGPVGLPGYGWQAQIVDKQGVPLPFGETGELIVKGPGVMKAYYKDPQATASTIKSGWLFTGDMARYDKDGFIWLVDRKKDVIIYGGENIFPVEIENFFLKHEKIRDIAVIGIPDDRLGELPAGIISLKPGTMMCEQDILDFQRTLPRYKQLKKIFFGDVPRNPTGKIEKPKLRRIYAEDKRKSMNLLLK